MEPVVTVSLSEYNDLIKYKDLQLKKLHDYVDAKRKGIHYEWKDIEDSHEINALGQIYKFTRSITKI